MLAVVFTVNELITCLQTLSILYLKLDILYLEIQDSLSCGRVMPRNVKCDRNDSFLFSFHAVHILELHTQELI